MGSNATSLRILRVADVSDNRHGGMSRTMHCTGDCLVQAGHHVDYLFHESFSWRIPRQFQRYFRSWEAAAIIQQRLARGEQWDVIEFHEPLALAYGWSRRRNPQLPPMVVFSYGIESRSYSAMSSYREKKSIPFPLKSRLPASVLVWQAAAGVKLASHVICSNQQDVNFLHDSCQIPSGRLTRHHSGIEAPFLVSGLSETERSKKGVLFVGNWIERKGILDMVPAVTGALRVHIDAHFTVAGCNCPPEAILSAFPDALRHRIRVIPQIHDMGEMIRVYAGHSIMLLPSYFEGHPLVMVEAAAMGLAIITTPICGMLDFITNLVNGMFVDVGNAEHLESVLLRLLADQEITVRLGAAAREVAKSHTWESATVKIEVAYRLAQADSDLWEV